MTSHRKRRWLHAAATAILGALTCSGTVSMAAEPAVQAPALTPEPSEAVKKASRANYANYIGNTLTCWYTPQDTCHLWLYADGTFDSFGYVNGKKTLDIDYPPPIGRKNRTGLSWWATSTPGHYQLCLKHNLEVLPQLAEVRTDGIICYELQNQHKIGEVWEEPDGTGRISRMGLLKGFQ